MKKLLTVLLTLLIFLTVSACNKKEENEIRDLFNEGYVVTATTNDGEKTYKCLLNNDDKNIAVIASIGSKELEELAKLDIFSDTYEDDQKDFICSLSNYEIRSLDDVIPSQEELDKLIGLTFAELENLGFENTGYIETDNQQFNFFFDNYKYEITVRMQEGVTIENMDDYSTNDIRQLIVGGVDYPMISSYILETIN